MGLQQLNKFLEDKGFLLKFLLDSNTHLSIHSLQEFQFRCCHKSSLRHMASMIFLFLREVKDCRSTLGIFMQLRSLLDSILQESKL